MNTEPKTNVVIPECSIKLDGFPLCAFAGACPSEVAEEGQCCPQHGGPEFSTDIWRRMLLRQLRSATKQVVECCGDVRTRPDRLGACAACKVHSGVVWGLGGLLERMGSEDLAAPYFEIVLDHVDGGRW